MAFSISGAPAPSVVTGQNFTAAAPETDKNQAFTTSSADTAPAPQTAPVAAQANDPATANGVKLSPEIVTALQESSDSEETNSNFGSDQQSEAAVALGGKRGDISETNLVKGDANAAEVAEAESTGQAGEPVAPTISPATGGDSETARNPLNLQI